MPCRAVLFDFDGTLADSFEAITASTNHVRTRYGLHPLPESVVREFVGFGLRHLMEKLVPGTDPDESVRCYREHHPLVMTSGTRLLPGVAETLATLHQRQYLLAVCSNKQVAFTKSLVESFGLSGIMREVLGPEDVGGHGKPDPAMVLECLQRLRVTPQDSVFIGDMAIDVHTGKAANVPVWLVPGGAAGQESAQEAGPDRVLASFSDLLSLLPGVVQCL